MPSPADETLDPSAKSWVVSANASDTDFPLQNLPLGIFRPRGSQAPWRAGVAIGEKVLDLAQCVDRGLFGELSPVVRAALSDTTLNRLLASGAGSLRSLRASIHRLLRSDASPARQAAAAPLMVEASECEHTLPMAVGNFSDFFASIHHARNVARLRDLNAPLPSSYPYTPMAYHARASSILISGTAVHRPWGGRRTQAGAVYAASDRLDYEVELGLIVGSGSALGTPIAVGAAHQHLAGVCLLNDWSARDIQAFEAQPLGPFLAKSFASTISPWVVTTQALEPFRVPAAAREPDVAAGLPHLLDADDQARGAWTITVECWLTTRAMRESGAPPVRLSRADARTLFWTPAQLVTHQTSNGCNLQTGDLLGTGTISGPERETLGCLLELTRGGREPLTLTNGETRAYLHDDDEITVRGFSSAPGAIRIGFGECRGRIVPARRDL